MRSAYGGESEDGYKTEDLTNVSGWRGQLRRLVKENWVQ